MTQLHLAGIPEIANPTSWGNWKYNHKHQTIIGELGLDFPKGAMYVIPINRCRTSAQKCDWLAQIAEKTWGTPEVLGYLVQALDAVVGLRPEVGER